MCGVKNNLRNHNSFPQELLKSVSEVGKRSLLSAGILAGLEVRMALRNGVCFRVSVWRLWTPLDRLLDRPLLKD